MKTIARILLFALLAACVSDACAQQSIVQTRLFTVAERRIGAEYRDALKTASLASERGDTQAAWDAIAPALRYCDAQQRPGRRIVSVATTSEYDAYVAAAGDGTPTEWIDIACPASYRMAGFLRVAAKQTPEALAMLRKAMAIAPYYADPYNEQGFALNQTGELKGGIASYRKAIAIADAHPSAAYAKPMALRGIGWALVESGDLAGARRAYEESLKLDPDNTVAKNELKYIDGKMGAGK